MKPSSVVSVRPATSIETSTNDRLVGTLIEDSCPYVLWHIYTVYGFYQGIVVGIAHGYNLGAYPFESNRLCKPDTSVL